MILAHRAVTNNTDCKPRASGDDPSSAVISPFSMA